MVDGKKINQHDDISYDSEWSYQTDEDTIESSRRSWIPFAIRWRYNAYVKYSIHRVIYKLSNGRYPRTWVTLIDEMNFMTPSTAKVFYKYSFIPANKPLNVESFHSGVFDTPEAE